ncbi:quinone oxidoreductase family protein [Streptomyces marincola]|uniref:quinone oxidoreductase family protein n=1 Tax=Streptomyces marincola TaxID=2878388 RepID=UPI001CF22B2C|nr:quinone oxidoreductase [Streptomyces marincola]UCM86541.1 quinone oxidoreductase [Streptomyces marincola]
MRAIVATRFGGPEVLRHVDDQYIPEPGPGQVLVDVAASGVNFIDVAQRRGVFPVAAPFVPGVEAAGHVSELGPGVDGAGLGIRIGDRVAWAMDGSPTTACGAYAEHAVVTAERLVRVPAEVPLETAAGLLMQGMTAHYLTHDTYPVGPGDTVLVHAAGGGLGQLLTRYAVALGARVIATASTPAKREAARAAGAHAAVAYEGFADAVREFTGGAGVAVAYDGVGAATFDGSLDCLRVRGLLVLLGASGGPVREFDTGRLLRAGSAYLTRPGIVDYIADRAALTRRADDVWRRAVAGELRTESHSYALADAWRAHEDLESRRTTGKLILLP